MEIDDALAKSPFVAISNLELFEICWLLDLHLSSQKDYFSEKVGLEKVRITLIDKGAVLINCTPVHDLQNMGSYKILSENHGFFKQTAYEGQAFIQICLDVIDENISQYAIMAIADYNGTEISQMWLSRYHSLKSSENN